MVSLTTRPPIESAKFFKSKSTYHLGRFIFSIENCDADYLEEIDGVVPHYAGPPLPEESVLSVKTACTKDLREIFGHLAKRHPDCIWINAAYLMSPAGKKVLFSGAPGAGRTTLIMALVLGHGWKLVNTDWLLLDLGADLVIPFLTPFPYKPETLELLQTSIGKQPETKFAYGWASKKEFWSPLDQSHIAQSGWDLELDFGFYLETQTGENDGAALQKIEPSQFLRKLLPISNMLRRPESLEILNTRFSGAQIFDLKTGNLEQTIAAVLETCGA